MRPTLLRETLKAHFRSHQQRSISIEGEPGGGKTSTVLQTAQELGVPCVTKHMPTMLVEDFGVPFVDAGSTSFGYKMPDWFPSKGKEGTEKGGILLFDDRGQAVADIQKVLANIQQARTLHGVPLADRWMVISTGNRASDRAGANRVLSHLADRETTYQYETHLDDWTSWAMSNGVHKMVTGFIRFVPAALHDFDPQRDKNATPRGWVEGVSAALGVVPPEAEYETFCGAVGDGRAAEFRGYAQIYRSLPDPMSILLSPDTAKLPTDVSTLYALAGALSDRVTETTFGRMVTYFDRLPEDQQDISVLAVSYAVRSQPDLAHTGEFTKWAVSHQNVLF
jgi:hypothetical protein